MLTIFQIMIWWVIKQTYSSYINVIIHVYLGDNCGENWKSISIFIPKLWSSDWYIFTPIRHQLSVKWRLGLFCIFTTEGALLSLVSLQISCFSCKAAICTFTSVKISGNESKKLKIHEDMSEKSNGLNILNTSCSICKRFYKYSLYSLSQDYIYASYLDGFYSKYIYL